MDTIIGGLKSKTIWLSVAAIIVPAISDGVQQWIATHPGTASTVVGVAFAVLRAVTTSSLAEKA
ncbi:hypothetical protein UFOVP83_3 [uncultured Caudovirales phage]|uniref:Holin n=1 Tax=uncultured Caudovirales phage TaxID=2100421 RepID=A0A6J5TDR5_9CAUD|nr:hypothetical protein UFOVP83_3 [uncultured Caudovirales phage]